VDGRCSVISIFRLRPEFHEAPPDVELLLQRAAKTATHELGHTFGLTHCRDSRCVMSSSAHIEATDAKGEKACRTCSDLLRWHMQRAGIDSAR
jgi:archaemetzincin